MSHAILHDSPEARIVVLLIDERPEEVTHFRRSCEGVEVVASTSDHVADEHCELAELMLAHVQTELECGHEVVLMIDSLTRVGRAFNSRTRRGGESSRPTMTGGLEAGILEIPRRLFGLARNIENGGSVTIIATCLVDTGSKMDQMIFEEFKGTGNSELVLDRSLAELRIFPAINIPASGTRKEAKLYTPAAQSRLGHVAARHRELPAPRRDGGALQAAAEVPDQRAVPRRHVPQRTTYVRKSEIRNPKSETSTKDRNSKRAQVAPRFGHLMIRALNLFRISISNFVLK